MLCLEANTLSHFPRRRFQCDLPLKRLSNVRVNFCKEDIYCKGGVDVQRLNEGTASASERAGFLDRTRDHVSVPALHWYYVF